MYRPRRNPTLWVLGVAVTMAAGVLATADASQTSPELDTLRLLAVDAHDSAVTLAWSGKAEHYRIQLDSGSGLPLADLTTHDRTATIGELDSTGVVRYRVQATDGSAADLVGTLVLPPTKAAKPTVKAIGSDSVVLRWPKVEHATAYDLELANTDDPDASVVVKRMESTTFVTDDLEPDTSYQVRVRAVNHGVIGEYGPAQELATTPTHRDITVGSWNLCAESCRGFGGRIGAITAQIQAANIDIMTVQEAGWRRVGNTTHHAIHNGGTGLVLAHGGGRARYVYYRKELFSQVSGGQVGLGNSRWATWARLKDKATEIEFIVTSIHLTPGKSRKADSRRASETRSLLAHIARLNPDGVPVVLAGDFNSGRHRRGERVIGTLHAAGWVDSALLADETTGSRINTGSRNGNKARFGGSHVDHILVPESLQVPWWKQYAALWGTRYVGPFLSDHNMIAAQLRLEKAPDNFGKPTPATPIPTAD